MLDVTRLRVLAAVARHGSVTAAAKSLNYAQPSVSHHLARLEAETGTRLVELVRRGVQPPTRAACSAGRRQEILGRLDAAEQELAVHVGQREERSRVAGFPSALATMVPAAAAARLRVEYPDVELLLAEADPQGAVPHAPGRAGGRRAGVLLRAAGQGRRGPASRHGGTAPDGVAWRDRARDSGSSRTHCPVFVDTREIIIGSTESAKARFKHFLNPNPPVKFGNGKVGLQFSNSFIRAFSHSFYRSFSLLRSGRCELCNRLPEALGFRLK